MAGQLTAELNAAIGGSSVQPASTPAPRPRGSGSSASDGPLMVVPAGFFGDVIGSLAETIGGGVGQYFGNQELGKAVGGAAGPLIKHFSPFQVLPPTLAPASAGEASSGSDEAQVVIPAGFLSGLLGGVGGKLLGGAVGSLFGNKDLGATIGGTALGAVGSALGPFSLVPAADSPQDGEPTVLVPAGWLGSLLGGIAGTAGQLIGGDTGGDIGKVAGSIIESVVPWSAVPAELTPASAGPEGETQKQELVVVPAGWLGSLLSSVSATVGGGVGGLLGHAAAGQQIGEAAKPLLEMLPFSVVPTELQPASATDTKDAGDELVMVPAGLFGGLIGTLGGLLGSVVGGKTGTVISGAAELAGKFAPFQVLPES